LNFASLSKLRKHDFFLQAKKAQKHGFDFLQASKFKKLEKHELNDVWI
jgi:hypothetical protein